jgi:hypothetical protein
MSFRCYTLLLLTLPLLLLMLAGGGNFAAALVSQSIATNTDNNGNIVVTVEFYGEAQCPYCRKFVQEAWPTVWEDDELMKHVQYDFVAWGNAYFSTAKCSSSSSSSSSNSQYDPQERACWYKECIETSPDNIKRTEGDDDCFSGKVIYQHSEKEGMVDIYENCVKLHYGLETAVDFTYCCEGPNMDDPTLATAHDLLVKCANGDDSSSAFDADVIQDCLETHGHIMEVLAAKQTPSHPGVPYVVVDGESLEDPFSIQKAICDRLVDRMMMMMMMADHHDEHLSSSFRLPKACAAKDEEVEATVLVPPTLQSKSY